MSAFLAIVLFCACVYLGNRKAAALRGRKKTLVAMQEDIRRLSEQMELRPAPIGELLQKFAPATEVFWEAFHKKLTSEASVGELWAKAMAEAALAHNGFDLLTDEEKSILADYGVGLAAIGLAAQTANAALACKRLEQRIAVLDAELMKKGKLFESLGMLAGLALALLVI